MKRLMATTLLLAVGVLPATVSCNKKKKSSPPLSPPKVEDPAPQVMPPQNVGMAPTITIEDSENIGASVTDGSLTINFKLNGADVNQLMMNCKLAERSEIEDEDFTQCSSATSFESDFDVHPADKSSVTHKDKKIYLFIKSNLDIHLSLQCVKCLERP